MKTTHDKNLNCYFHKNQASRVYQIALELPISISNPNRFTYLLFNLFSPETIVSVKFFLSQVYSSQTFLLRDVLCRMSVHCITQHSNRKLLLQQY